MNNLCHSLELTGGDYFDITCLYQQLVYWKKIAVQGGISLKTI